MENVLGAESFPPSKFVVAVKIVDISIIGICNIIISVAILAVYTAAR